MTALFLALSLLPGQVLAAADSVSLDISAGSIVITETGYTHGAGEETPFTGRYIITQSDPSPTANTVAVTSGAADITFTSRIIIDVSGSPRTAAFSVASGASAVITLAGNVFLESGQYCAGLQVTTGTSVTVRATKSYWSLTATGGAYGAGIGGGSEKPAGNITVESGMITANGGGGAAGIGGGSGAAGTGTGETIRISGGTVTAKGGYDSTRVTGTYYYYAGAGIGGGGFYQANTPGTGENGAIVIEGNAHVTATGASYGAGIGGGGYDKSSYSGNGTGTNGRILITDHAVVTATGGSHSAGIGGGNYSDGTGEGGSITISGQATVTATGGAFKDGSTTCGGAGIGGGYSGDGTGTDGTITITDSAAVTAVSQYRYAIGGDYGTGTRGKIVISGSPHVEATGKYAGIGGSHATGSYGAINISGGTVIATATYTATSSTSTSGIGGSTASYGAVNITGGYITATGPYGMSAANLYGGTVTAVSTYTKATSGFYTSPTVPDGSYPWVFASPAAPEAVSGVFFSGETGVMYGAMYLTEQDQEIPAGHTLTVKAGQTLIVTEGTTLTVNGTLIIEGEIIVEDENGLIPGEGALLEGNIPHDHALTAYAAKEATCGEAGCIAHWRCGYCGRYFADEAGTEELTVDEVILPALGHDFENGKCGNCDLEVKDATLLVSTVSGTPGQTVRVPLSLVNNPGIISAKVDISFDDTRLELVGVEDGGLLQSPLFGDTLASPYSLTWENGDLTDDITSDGVLATLIFKVKDSSAMGAAAVTAAVSNTYCAALGEVEFSVMDGAVNVVTYIMGDANGDGVASLLDAALMRRFIAHWTGVTINEAAADLNGDGSVGLDDVIILRRHLAGWDGYELPYDGPAIPQNNLLSVIPSDGAFTVSDAVAQPGDLVVLDVSLSDNPGIIAALLELNYDPTQLELVSAQDCKVLGQGVFGDSCANVPYILSWEDGSAAENVTADGMVVTLTFRVLEGCGEAEVSVRVAESFDAALNPVSFRTVSGTVYGNVITDYDKETGKVSVSNLPAGVVAYAAAYRNGQMVWVGTPEETDLAPADADSLKIMFVNGDWSPAGPCRPFDL